jgi:hypothetical protein
VFLKNLVLGALLEAGALPCWKRKVKKVKEGGQKRTLK